VLVLVRARELKLPTQPLLVRGEIIEPSLHVVENGIIYASRQIIHVEQATKVSVVA